MGSLELVAGQSEAGVAWGPHEHVAGIQSEVSLVNPCGGLW